jgi:host factor-I protein
MVLKVRPNALQDTLFRHLCNHKAPVTIYLVNGVRLQGVVTEIDDYCMLLNRGHDSQLVYKSAISSMMPDQSERGPGYQSTCAPE